MLTSANFSPTMHPAAPDFSPILHQAGAPDSIGELLDPFFAECRTSARHLQLDSRGSWQWEGREYSMPRVIFRGTESDEAPVTLALFAGIHGDEEAGVLAVIDFLQFLERNPFLGRAFHLHVYPLCNPTGFARRTRESGSGRDLNREFWRGSKEPEVAILERELGARSFHGIIALHSDDTSDGLYGFVRGAILTEHLLKPALAAAEAALPVNEAAIIDGFHAVNGIIHTAYDGILTAPPGSAPAPFEIILESPHHAPMHLQRHAFMLALTEIVREYRRLISYGADL